MDMNVDYQLLTSIQQVNIFVTKFFLSAFMLTLESGWPGLVSRQYAQQSDVYICVLYINTTFRGNLLYTGRKYTPLYEKGIKKTENKSMETTFMQLR